MLASLDVAYVDTKAADLVWTLNHPVLPALATVTITLPSIGATLDLRVLGASHQAVVTWPGGELVETVACLPGQPPYLPTAARQAVGWRGYSFSSRVDHLGVADIRAHARRLAKLAERREPDGDTVVAAFPTDPDAVTALSAHPHAAGVAWRTWHLYPNSRQIVTTGTEVV